MNEEYVICCNSCDSSEFRLFPDGHIRCAECNGYCPDAKVTFDISKLIATSSSPQMGAQPVAEA